MNAGPHLWDKTAPWTVCIATAVLDKVTVNNVLAQQPESVEAGLLSGNCILRPERMVVRTRLERLRVSTCGNY
jgi:hypothetical protein